MAYTRHNWVCGEVINDTKMNNIEDGIEEALECCGGGSEPLILSFDRNISAGDYSYGIYDKTWQEVQEAFLNGIPIYLNAPGGYLSLSYYYYDDADGNLKINFVDCGEFNGEFIIGAIYQLERLFANGTSSLISYDGRMCKITYQGEN